MTVLAREIRGAENKVIRGVGSGWKGTSMERFWRKVELDPVTGCLVWIGSRSSAGYGNFYADDRCNTAHRWLWERFEGEVPDGLELDHLCRNRACVNLLHLEPVTGSENQLRGINPELTRARAAARTHCRNGHEFTEANTWREASGARHCRKCHAEAVAEARRRDPERSRANNRRYEETHKEERRLAALAYYQRNREMLCAKARERRAAR